MPWKNAPGSFGMSYGMPQNLGLGAGIKHGSAIRQDPTFGGGFKYMSMNGQLPPQQQGAGAQQGPYHVDLQGILGGIPGLGGIGGMLGGLGGIGGAQQQAPAQQAPHGQQQMGGIRNQYGSGGFSAFTQPQQQMSFGQRPQGPMARPMGLGARAF